ncbi:hypothetical protein [Sorangium sp. So ce887]|uniref:hypothetical protein n=1 Tax=Sorangium sp. So ce887 TaxID=3133324 RepID=UPI003F637590
MVPLSVAPDVDVAPDVEAELDVPDVEDRHAPAMGAAPPATRRSLKAARRFMGSP